MTNPLSRPSWRGRSNVDNLTIAAIEKAESLRPNGGEFYITQGSYQSGGGDINSAGTHDGGGAVDIRWTGSHEDIRALRLAGFAAWFRSSAQGPWVNHIHAILVDHPKLSVGAANQVKSYRARRNGLANNGPDDGPRLNPIPVFDWNSKDELDMDEKTLRGIIRDELKGLTTELEKFRNVEDKRDANSYRRERAMLDAVKPAPVVVPKPVKPVK